MAPLSTSKRTIHSSLSRSRSVSSNSLINKLIALFAILFIVCLILYLSALNAAVHDYSPDIQVKERSQVRTAEIELPEMRKIEPKPVLKRKEIHAAGEKIGDKTESLVKETLVLTTDLGKIKIVLRPDLSKESVDYIHRMAGQNCKRCKFYRAEKPSILQGILAAPDVPISTVKGSCPKGYENVKNECPTWDSECACHGPVMEHGMVGWAAGKTGPDFFIDAAKRKGTWWGTQHTVWGRIEDDASFAVIDHVWTLPAEKEGGLTMLKHTIHFTMEIV